MSEILIIVPPEWTLMGMEIITNAIGMDAGYMETLQGQAQYDLNERLEAANYFTDDRRVTDVMVLNGQVYFKLE